MFQYKPKNIPLIHFIGIGGIGMSGMAQILIQLGYKVQGSDIAQNSNIQRLAPLGVKIFIGHKQENIEHATMVVYTSAIKKDNPEFVQALTLGIPTMPRGEMLAQLMRLKFGVAIGGTHGKTTTTSMVATMALGCAMDPTFLVGGVVPNLGGSARVGKSELLITESDESDGSFELLGPAMAVVTNIDDDHLDYHGNKDNLITSFESFLRRVPFYGLCVINAGNKTASDLIHRIARPVVTYGAAGQNFHGHSVDYFADAIEFTRLGMSYDLYYQQSFVQKIHINQIGIHNVENSLAALAVVHHLGASFEKMSAALSTFTGVGRRMELLWSNSNSCIFDDYAHHPTEIRAVIAAVNKSKQLRPIVIFEPHRYSRTKSLWTDFLYSFEHVEKLYVLPIYSAQEDEIPGVSALGLMEDINRLHPNLGHYIDDPIELENIIREHVQSTKTPSLILTLGAGSIGKRIRDIVSNLH